MSTSTYTLTRDQVISSALRKLGVLEIGVTPDTDTVNNAAISLNLLIKQLSTEGLKLWKIQELVLPLTANKQYYVLGGPTSSLMYDTTNPGVAITDRPLKVLQAFYRNTQATPDIDVPLMVVSKSDYNLLGSKTSTGASNTVLYDSKINYGILYVYLMPDTATATNTELHLVAQMPLNDTAFSSDVLDFPNEWVNCLVWNLADQLAIEYGVPMNYRQEIAQRALQYKNQLTDWDVEVGSTSFVPSMMMSRMGY